MTSFLCRALKLRYKRINELTEDLGVNELNQDKVAPATEIVAKNLKVVSDTLMINAIVNTAVIMYQVKFYLLSTKQ